MKNITILILIISLLTGIYSPITAFGEEPVVTTTVPQNVTDAANLLSAIGIISGDEKGDFGFDRILTRAEFAVMTYRLLGFEKNSLIAGEELNLTDLESGNWAEKAMRTLVSMGYIEKFEDGTVKPNEEIQTARMLYMLVKALGYDLKAEVNGGYPNGYMVQANNLGLLKDVASLTDKAIKRSEAILVINKAIKTDKMVQNGFGADASYSISKGYTLIQDSLGILQRTGIVTANDITTLKGPSDLKENQIAIDGIIFEPGKAKVENLLGFNVSYYYTYDQYSDSRTLVYIIKSSKNNALEINAEDILESTTKNVIKYTKDKDSDIELKASMQPDAYVIYNDMAYGALQAGYIVDNDFKPADGKIILIDNDGDGDFNVARITSYEIYVLQTRTEKEIYDKINIARSKVLDIDDNNVKLSIIKNDSETEVKFLDEWDVVAITESKNNIGKKIINATVLSTSFTGFIEEVSDDKITVKGKSYDISPNYPTNNAKYNLKLGYGGTFFLDTNERIVLADISNSMSLKYGFLFATQPGKGFSTEAQFKILDIDNKWTIRKSLDKIKYNGTERVPANDVANILRDKKQLITYSMNESELLTELNTAVDKTVVAEGATSYIGYDDEVFSLDYIGKTGARTYGGFIGNKFKVAGSIAFVGPRETDAGYSLEKNFGFGQVPNDTSLNYFEIYDNTKLNVPYLVKYYGTPSGGGASIIYTMAVSVLDRIVDSYDTETGDIRKKAYFMQNGKEVGYNISDNDLKDTSGLVGYSNTKLVDLKKGSTMQVGLNVANEIDNIVVFMNIDAPPSPFKNTSQLYWEMYGTTAASEAITNVVDRYSLRSVIVDISADVMIVNAHSDGTDHKWDRTFTVGGVQFYLYDKKTGKITSIMAADVVKGDEVAIQCFWNFAKVALVIRD